MFDNFKNIILSNEYISYLNHLSIDTSEIIKNIRIEIEKNKHIFNNFTNRSVDMYSPNIFLKNIIFEEVNKYLYKDKYDLNIFKKGIELDIKTLIATQNSIIERPKISRPSEIEEGFKTELVNINGFIQIARFENEMIKNENGWSRKGQTIVFEGLSVMGKVNPFFEDLSSSLIWNISFDDWDYPFIIGFIKKFNSIEADNTLWINSLLQNDLGLILDDFNNGFQALNAQNEVILKFRQWRSDLIGNGSSFVGQDSNIAKLEGCDLILREDYYKRLRVIIPDMEFYSKKLELS
jgi:hypothetical protein